MSAIKAVLHDTGREPSRLKLEITERAFIGDLAAAHLTLSGLSAIGVQWSLDDFGTGYSSLSYLDRLRVDTLKFDRLFISRIALDRAGSEMVRAIIALAHTLQIDVVGEGVETPEQLAALGEFGCDYAQGFLLAQALDAAGADRLIAEQPWRMPSLMSSGRGRAPSWSEPTTRRRSGRLLMDANMRDEDAAVFLTVSNSASRCCRQISPQELACPWDPGQICLTGFATTRYH